jgi:predicted phage terminase large subunit-like protein
MAGGIMSGMTGNRAHGLLIDDPLKGRQEADSALVRDRVWAAYQDDLSTRLIPGGWIALIQTRWHDNDLAGRLLPAEWCGESGDIVCRDGNTWRVVCIQAQCERLDDPVGRAVGEYLWPGWFSESHFAQFKRNPRTWNALYQQVPATDTGDYFKSESCQWYTTPPKHMRIYGASDFAVTANSGDFTEHGVFGVDANDDLYVLDWWYGQTQADVWIEEQLDLIKIHKPLTWYGEAGPIRRSVEPFLMKRSRERRVYCDFQWLPSMSDKPTRARSFQARWSMGKVYLPANVEWANRLLRQMTRFPAGAEDDAVDVCSLIGRAIDDIYGATTPQQEKAGRDGYTYEADDDDLESWKTA